MSVFFSKLFTLFQSKIAKNAVFALCCEISNTEVRLRFNLVRKCLPQLRNCVALQLNQKVHCGSCAALQKLKKVNCAFYAALLLVEKSLRCAFVIMLFVPTSESTTHGGDFTFSMQNVNQGCWEYQFL